MALKDWIDDLRVDTKKVIRFKGSYEKAKEKEYEDLSEYIIELLAYCEIIRD